jgi:zinc protease
VAKAKERLRIASVKARDGLSGPARLVANALGADLPLSDLQAWPERIASVTPADVMQAAAAVLTPENCVTAVLTPPQAPLGEAPVEQAPAPPAPIDGVDQ